MRRRSLLKVGAGALPALSFASTTASALKPTHQSFEPLDKLQIDGAAEVAVDETKEVAYVAASDGLAVVDISDPNDLSLLAEKRGFELGGKTLDLAFDLWYSEDRLVLGGPAQPKKNTGTGLVVFDVGDPAAPKKLTTYDTGYYNHNLFLDGKTLYVCGSGLVREERRIPLVIYDLSNDEPEEITRWSPVDHDSAWQQVPVGQRVLHDVYVHDDIAYLPYWDAGTWLLDVSDPASPEVLSRTGHYKQSELTELSRKESFREGTVPDGNSHYTNVNEDGTLLAVGRESWKKQTEKNGLVGGASGVTLYDVSDKKNPTKLSTIEPPESFDNTSRGWFTTAHNCDIAGDRLYTSWYFGGVKLHDISDPKNPKELAWWRNPRDANMWAAQAGKPGEFFVASSWYKGSDRKALNVHTPGVYTFPDHAGTQPDPVDLTSRPTDILGTQNDSTPTPTPAGGNDATPTPTPTPAGGNDATPTPTPTPMPDSQGGSGGSTPTDSQTSTPAAGNTGPGFSIGGALAGIGGAGYLFWQRQAENTDENTDN